MGRARRVTAGHGGCWACLVGRHMRVPGNPTFVIENMPGAVRKISPYSDRIDRVVSPPCATQR